MLPNHVRKALSVAFLALAVTASAAGAPIYMKYDGVEGDVARGHDKWIEVVSYQWAADRDGNASCATNRGSFTIHSDSKALPALTSASKSRRTFREVTLDIDGVPHTLGGAKVNKIDAFTVKQKVIDLSFDRCLTHSKASSKK